MIDVNKKDFVAKILIIGETKVGKSSVLTRFTENFFSEHLMPTLGYSKKLRKSYMYRNRLQNEENEC